MFVRQDGSTWYIAVFNYSIFSANKSLNLARLGISGTYTAVDLWSGAVFSVSGTIWNVSLGSRQAKLFRLGSGNTSAVGPTNQALVVGNSTTFSAIASGTPPFSYSWKKNGTTLAGQNANAITLSPVSPSDAGSYSVVVTGANGVVTNSATLTLLSPTNLTAQLNGGSLTLNWPVGYTGWRLQSQTDSLTVGLGKNWSNVSGSEITNRWSVSISATNPSRFFRLAYP